MSARSISKIVAEYPASGQYNQEQFKIIFQNRMIPKLRTHSMHYSFEDQYLFNLQLAIARHIYSDLDI